MCRWGGPVGLRLKAHTIALLSLDHRRLSSDEWRPTLGHWAHPSANLKLWSPRCSHYIYKIILGAHLEVPEAYPGGLNPNFWRLKAHPETLRLVLEL
jgi:hypothetical protein